MARSKDIHNAWLNGRSSGQYTEEVGINVRRLVSLLDASSNMGRHPAVRRASNALLELMAQSPWVVTAGPHVGGHGGDKQMHITLKILDSSYHVRLDGRGHVFEITGDGLDSVRPWLAPGSENKRSS